MKFFLVVSMWLFDGTPKLIGGGWFDTEAECIKAAQADYNAKKSSVAALKVECRSTPPRPAGLPENQPHVPGKVSA